MMNKFGEVLMRNCLIHSNFNLTDLMEGHPDTKVVAICRAPNIMMGSDYLTITIDGRHFLFVATKYWTDCVSSLLPVLGQVMNADVDILPLTQGRQPSIFWD